MTKKRRYTLMAAAGFLCIAMLFLGNQINTTRAALLQGGGSEVQMDLASLDVKLIENDVQVTDDQGQGQLLTGLQGRTIDPGYTYEEKIAVKNTGASPQFVRVILTKYWTKDETKETSVKPEMIQLLQESDDWFINQAESTAEQTVYYYKKALPPGETTPLLFGGVRLDPSIAGDFQITGGSSGVRKAAFAYSGLSFHVDAEAQAVQYKYAEDAIPSAWGVKDLKVTDDVLSLAQ